MTTLPHPAPARPPEPTPAPAPKRRWPLFAAGSLLVIGLGVPLALWRTERTQQTAAAVKRLTVQRGAMEVRLRISGSTAARQFTGVIAPQLRGPESDQPMELMTLAPTGSIVRRGDLVAAFDPQGMRDHLDDTRDGLRDRESILQKRKAELALERERLQQRLLAAKGVLDRARLDLKTIEVRSAIRAEIFRLAVEESEALYRAVQEEARHQLLSQQAALRMTEISRDLEILHVKRHEVDLTRLEVFAPSDGVVVVESQSRRSGDVQPYRQGDRLTPGALFARVVNPRSMRVEATVNQAEVERFEIGQEATVRLDAFPGAAFRARLESIGALATQGGRREQFYYRTVPVVFQILDQDSRLLPGLSASADVLVGKLDQTLLVPAQAVEVENGQPFVQVETAQGVEKRPITAGPTDGLQVAVLQGLNEGDILIVD